MQKSRRCAESRPRFPAAAVLAVPLLLLLAGCASKNSSDTTSPPPAPDANSYTVTLSNLPTAPLEAGQTFRFNSTIAGAVERASDHIGAHMGRNSTTAPTTTAYPIACQHQSGQLPGTYEITCAAPMEPGVYYFRGHARITTANNTAVNWWSSEASFTVVPLQA